MSERSEKSIVHTTMLPKREVSPAKCVQPIGLLVLKAAATKRGVDEKEK